LTTTDMMTKLKMKHYFFTVLMERLEVGGGQKPKLGVIMLDIDHFKKFNDTYGHSCGDVVLKQVAHTIMDNLRPMDIAARYGGEEFVCLISNATKELNLSVAERIRQAVEGMETDYEGTKLKVTLSCGVACYRQDVDFSAKALVDRADRALYRSKQEGRNRVTYAE
jgi:diguanylate cyclase (GGDEF)-like protein